MLLRRSLLAPIATLLAACGGSDDPPVTAPPVQNPAQPVVMTVSGRGAITDRYTAEVWVHGGYAYTSTWWCNGCQRTAGNAIFIWDVKGAAPTLVDSVIVPPVANGVPVRTTGDVQVSDDGKLLVIPTELAPGSLEVYDLTNPTRPRALSRFTSPNIQRGVHTAELQRVAGTLYAFLSVNSASTHRSRLLIVDLSDPANPREVMFRDMGNPFIHDVYVRDGILFTALWNDGMVMWDIGGGGKGGTVQNPIEITRLLTVNGQVHNIWWLRDASTGAKRYAIIGEEGAARLFDQSSGDIHVVDLENLAAPREVAFYSVAGAGTHNFSVDENRKLLYAAYYNAGVHVLDLSGNPGTCTLDQKGPDGRCDMKKAGRLVATGVFETARPVFVWGVQYTGDAVYASDMLNGLVKLQPVTR
ncbi:MAG TPA: hypothetical protein VFV33_19525 [Gemmatimonadaceae bacterium]|nr:hypothetical protein [Gemmatimonadaceae bacterium]